MTKIGKRIKDVLTEKGLRQIHLAEGTGIPKSTLSEIINGKKKTSVENMQLVADFLDVDLHWLVKGDAYQQSPGKAQQVAEALGRKQYNRGKPSSKQSKSIDSLKDFNKKHMQEIFKILKTLSDEERGFILEMVQRLKNKNE